MSRKQKKKPAEIKPNWKKGELPAKIPLGKEGLTRLADKDLAKTENVEMPFEKQYSIKQRLLRRQQQPVSVTFTDDLGEFAIAIRLLDPAEQQELMQLQNKLLLVQVELEKARGENQGLDLLRTLASKAQATLNELYEYAGKICVDPELNEAYWKAGRGFTADVPITLIREAITRSQQVRSDVGSFRQNSERERTVSNVPRAGKNPK